MEAGLQDGRAEDLTDAPGLVSAVDLFHNALSKARMPGIRMEVAMSFTHANIVSILVAAVAAWIFGGIYYTGLGKWWMAAQGKTLEQCKAEQASKSAVANGGAFVLVFLAEIIMAWVLYGILVASQHVHRARRPHIRRLCWLGFVLTTIASNNAFSTARPCLTVIDSVAWLGALLIIGAILGGFGP